MGRDDSKMGRDDSKMGRDDSKMGREDSKMDREDSHFLAGMTEYGADDDINEPGMATLLWPGSYATIAAACCNSRRDSWFALSRPKL